MTRYVIDASTLHMSLTAVCAETRSTGVVPVAALDALLIK
jgi:hypothetical protein